MPERTHQIHPTDYERSYAEFVTDHLRIASEAASLAVAPWLGGEDKESADKAAVVAFEDALRDSLPFSCRVVIGEGEKDEAPMLTHGELFGSGEGRIYDLAIDPLEGTAFAAEAKPGALAIAALAPENTFPEWMSVPYMKKLVVGAQLAKLLDSYELALDGDERENLSRAAALLKKPVNQMRVAVLDRPRNERIIDALTTVGAQTILLSGGDVIPALQTCFGTYEDASPKIDILYGSGGAPKAVLTASMIATMGGNMQVMWDPQTREERLRVEKEGKLDVVLSLGELVGNSELYVVATAITQNPLLKSCTQNQDGTYTPGQTLLAYRTVGGANHHEIITPTREV